LGFGSTRVRFIHLGRLAERVGFSLAIFSMSLQGKEIAIRPFNGSTCVLSTIQTLSTTATLNIHSFLKMVWMVWMRVSLRGNFFTAHGRESGQPKQNPKIKNKIRPVGFRK
jgi:hypothetical protein